MAKGTNDSPGSRRGEELIEVQRRRRWTFVEKLRAAQEASAPGTSVSSVARKYGLAPSQLFRWRKLFRKTGQDIVPPADRDSNHGELQSLKRRVRDLERLLGKMTLENDVLREAVSLRASRRQPAEDLWSLTDQHR